MNNDGKREMSEVKKYVSIILSLCTVFLLLSGCTKSETSETGTKTESTDTAITSDAVELFVDGKAVYNVVKPENASEEIKNAAATVYKNLKSAGAVNKNVTDYEEASEYEILIGNTKRPESDTALKYLRDNSNCKYANYIICTVGKKIVIAGLSDEACVLGAEYFAENLCGKKTIDGGVLKLYETEGDFASMTLLGVSPAEYVIVRPHYNSSYITQMQIESLQNTLKEQYGINVPVVEDAYTDSAEHEIIVGDAAREGVEKISDRDEYRIIAENGKIYLNGGHSYSTAMAVSEFEKLVKTGSVDAVSLSGKYGDSLAGYDRANYYAPVWHDDFDGNSINDGIWRLYGIGDRDKDGKNGKIATRSDDPTITRVSDGFFKISAEQDDKYYYGGMITTEYRMEYKYGYIETSEKMPDGDGFWTCLWLCRGFTGYSDKELFDPEFDINECFGDASVFSSQCHRHPTEYGESMGATYTCIESDHTRKSLDGRKYSDDFHTFGALWTRESIAFTCDGEVYLDYPINKDGGDSVCFNDYMFVRYSMVVGQKTGPQDINNATKEQWENTNTMYGDWVYLYQINDGKQSIVKLN